MSEIQSIIDTNPFPGLRPFQPDEADLFFGREEQVDKLLQKLQASHFVAVIGPSGCGKSSLVKAGLIPALRTGFLAEAGTNWRIAQMRPGDKPFYYLAKTLLRSFKDEISPEHLKAELKRCRKSLIEFLKNQHLSPRENFLLIIDQFEELFRFKENNNINEVTAFIDSLIASVKNDELPFHIVITMRSDYLGECSLFADLPEILNDNQFLTPVLTREQTQEAIEGPAMVCGGYLEPQLVTTLLNDIRIGHDQLPLLQHTLMRMWNYVTESNHNAENKMGDRGNGSSSNNTYEIILNTKHYNTVGRLSCTLSNHLNDVYDKNLNTKQRRIAEIMFKRLSERNPEQKDIRRPCTVCEISTVADVSAEEVIDVANYFRAKENNFLVTDSDDHITAKSYLDISHESILRQWDKMKIWIASEYEAAAKFQRMAADANEYYNRKGELLSGNDLVNALEWQTENRPNKEWANRYVKKWGPGQSDRFEQVDSFIKDSRKRRKFIYMSVIGSIFLVLASITLFAYVGSRNKLKSFREIQNARVNTATQAARADEMNKQKNIVEGQKNEIEIQNKAIHQQNEELTSLAVQLRIEKESLSGSNLQLRIKDFTSSIKDSSFYNQLDSTSKNNAIADLLPLYLTNNVNKRQELIDSMKMILALENNLVKTPTANFRSAQKIWAKNKRPLIESMLTAMVNNHLFYQQKIKPSGNYFSFPFVAFSKDRNRFVMSDYYYNNVLMATYNKDSLIADKSFASTLLYRTSSVEDRSDFYQPISSIVLANDTIMYLKSNGKIFERNPHAKRSSLIGTIPYVDKYQRSEFSPDGQYLINASTVEDNEHTDSKDYHIRLWNISMIKKNLHSAEQVISTNLSGIQQMAFSPNSEKVFVTDNTGRLQIWKTGDTNTILETKNVLAAAFSENSKYLITLNSSQTVKIWDIANNASFAQTYVEINPYQPAAISFSADWKKMIITQTGKLNLYETTTGDSIFYLDRAKRDRMNPKLIVRELVGDQSGSKVTFLDNTSIVSVNKNGHIFFWKIYRQFNKLDKAFTDIKVPELTLEERLLEDSAYFNLLVMTGNKSQLDEASSYLSDQSYSPADYNKKTEIGNKLKMLYRKLLQMSTEDQKNNYLTKITFVNTDLNVLETTKPDPNYRLVVERYQENAAIGEQQLKRNVFSPGQQLLLSNTYWNLSWYLLFLKEYEKVIHSAKRGLEIYPKNDGINTNLALGYLLSDQYLLAEEIYKKYKGKMYSIDSRKFTEIFLKDLKDLEEEKIITSDKPKIYNHVLRIRALLR